MAGGIVVSDKKAVSIGSGPFHIIVEKIRECFEPGEEGVRASVFSPMDDGGMQFISAVDLSPEDYMVFYKAVKRTYRAFEDEHDLIVDQEVWDEIFGAFRDEEQRISDRSRENVRHES